MSEQIVCANCGIRYATDLAECPWCGTAPGGGSETPETQVGFEAPASEETPERAIDTTAAAAAAVAASGSDAVDVATPELQEVTPAQPEAPPEPETASAAAGAETRPAGDPAADAALQAEAPPPPTLPPVTPPPPAPQPTQSAAPTGNPQKGAAKPGRGRRFAWYAAAVIVLLVIGGLLAEFAPLGPNSGSSSESVTPVDPLGADDTLVIDTTEPPVTTTQVPQTTTVTTEPPATTLPGTSVPGIEPIGDSIPLDDLQMGVDGLLEALPLGDDGAVTLGRLAATFGQPDADSGATESTGELGTCSGDTVRIVRFGSLAVINTVADGEVFAAYRVDLDFQEAASEADELQTISGLRAGDTVESLQETYSTLDVVLLDDPDGASFELRSNGGALLLHGPLTGVDPSDEVLGIYSPDLCSS